jgi:electron transfer flavoprotein alpha subunit
MPRLSAAERAQWRGVWVVGEPGSRTLHLLTRQVLGAGARLAERLGEKLTLVLMGAEVGAAAETARFYGVHQIFVIEHPSLASYRTLAYAEVLSRLLWQERPNIVLLGATCAGRDLAPRVAARLRTGLTADALDLRIDEQGRFVQVCAGYGGRLLVDICCPEHRPQMVTVRANALPTPAPSPAPSHAEVVACFPGEEAADPVTVVAREADPHVGQVDLSEAKIVVGGGRGLKSRDHFARLYLLAQLLGGAVAATRPVVEAGWAPPSCQIGQTGLTVQPKLYLAFGISGAVQHLAGVSRAETIIAINNDPHAPIFEVADYGFVADAAEVLEKLIGLLQARGGGQAA